MTHPSLLPQLVRRLVHATVESLSAHPDAERERESDGQRVGWYRRGLGPGECVRPVRGSAVGSWVLDRRPCVVKRKTTSKEQDPRPLTAPDTSPDVFCFCHPRKWLKKAEWCEKKKGLGIWNDVRVCDSASLEEWLETAPAVDVWFARRLVGRRPEGVTDIDEHWANLAVLTYPSLNSKVFLASRDDAIKPHYSAIEVLKKWLEGPPGACAFEAQSPVETWISWQHVADLTRNNMMHWQPGY